MKTIKTKCVSGEKLLMKQKQKQQIFKIKKKSGTEIIYHNNYKLMA